MCQLKLNFQLYASRQQNKVFLLFDECKKPCRSFTPLLLTTITLESLFPVCWSLATISTRWKAACVLHLVPRLCLRCSNRHPARTRLIVCVAHHCVRSSHTGGPVDESAVALLNPHVMRDLLWPSMWQDVAQRRLSRCFGLGVCCLAYRY